MSNIEIIANYIKLNPGCQAHQARRYLCALRGKMYKGNQYTWYFTAASPWAGHKMGADYGYWEWRDGGWHLTDKGAAKIQ